MLVGANLTPRPLEYETAAEKTIGEGQPRPAREREECVGVLDRRILQGSVLYGLAFISP